MEPLIIPLIIVFISFLILFLLGKRNEHKVRRDWQSLNDFSDSDSFLKIKKMVDSKIEAMDFAYGEAIQMKQLGSVDEAKKLLDVGSKIIIEFTPNLYGLITTMLRFTRMLVAITPFKPLSPGNFKVAQLTSLAVLNVVINQFLVSMKDRLRLKLYIIGKGLYMAGSYLVKSTRGIMLSKKEEEKDWERVDDLLNDYKELSRETLDCFKVIHDSFAMDARKLGN